MTIQHALGAMFRPLWRMRRGLTLGAQGIVVDETERILLIRHGYRPGWHFPGGGVEWGETIEAALRRELKEEAGIEIAGTAQLHGVFANFGQFPGDHIAVFVVRQWRQPSVPRPNAEVVEQNFFAINALPADMAPGARRRVPEVFSGRPAAEAW